MSSSEIEFSFAKYSQRLCSLTEIEDFDEQVCERYCRLLAEYLERAVDAGETKKVFDTIPIAVRKSQTSNCDLLGKFLSVLRNGLCERVRKRKFALCKVNLLLLKFQLRIYANSDHESQQNSLTELIEQQVVIVAKILLTNQKRFVQKTNCLARKFWSNNMFAAKLIALKFDSFETVVFVCNLLAVVPADSCYRVMAVESRPILIEAVVRFVFEPKLAIDFLRCSQPFFATIDRDEFETSFLPICEKSILRNAETVLEPIALLFAACESIDFAFCAVRLAKLITKSLNSTNEQLRLQTTDSLKNLFEKCGDLLVLESIVQLMIDIYYGSDGKVTVVEHKINILQIIENLSMNAKANEPKIVEKVANFLRKILENEVNEKVLMFVLDVVVRWAERTQIVPKPLQHELMETVRVTSAASGRKITSYLRGEYFDVLRRTWRLDGGSGRAVAVENWIRNDLKKTIEKQRNQLTDLNENLAQLELFLDVRETGRLPYALVKLMRLLSDDKLVGTATGLSDRTQTKLIRCCLKISVDPGDEINVIQRTLIWPLLNAFCAARKTDSKAFECLRLLRTTANGIKTARLLAFELNLFAVKYDMLRKPVRQFVLALASLSDSMTAHDRELFLVNSFLILNALPSESVDVGDDHTDTDSGCGTEWRRLFVQMGVEPHTFLKTYLSNLLDMLPMAVEIYECTVWPRIVRNAIESLVRLEPSTNAIEIELFNLCSDLVDSNYDFVTSAYECAIFETDAGRIYDRKVLDEIIALEKDTAMTAASCDTRNLKRESKVYSYKEQLEEIQLKRELEAKTAKQPPQHQDLQALIEKNGTRHQKDLLQQQKQKEDAIRTRMADLKRNMLRVLAILEGLSRGRRSFIETRLKLFHFRLLAVMKCSPLLANDIVAFLYRLSDAVVFRADKWKFFGRAIVAFLCANDAESSKIDIEIFMDTILARLPEITVPMFVFAYPILDYCLESSRNAGLILHKTLAIMTHFAKTKPFSNLDDDLWYSKHLPKLEMLRSLVKAIATVPAANQSQAIGCLIELGRNSNVNVSDDSVAFTEPELAYLLDSLNTNNTLVRDAIIRTIIESNAARNVIGLKSVTADLKLKFSMMILLARNDVDETIRALAAGIETPLFPPEKHILLFEFVVASGENVQRACADSLVALMQSHPNRIKVETVFNRATALYKEHTALIPAKRDQFDYEIEPERDPWPARYGLAVTIAGLVPEIRTETQIGNFVKFLIRNAFNDRAERVRREFLTAALRLIDACGENEAAIAAIRTQCERFVDTAPKTADYDLQREAVIVVMGNLARHFQAGDERIIPVLEKLLSALKTPSEAVQESVAECLHPLIKIVYGMPNYTEVEMRALVQKLIQELLRGDKYGERRGAAYGLAGIVKGMGIMSLKQFDVMTKLKHAIQDKKSYKQREGALFAFEILSKMLGRLFEPYVVHILPHLLTCFGDSSSHIRQAADDTARTVMSKLSAHGVKLVLPSLLHALEDDSWRTKTASIELLASMAYCAPKQLSSCLPSIVPPIIQVLSDSHVTVQSSALSALRLIGSVIRNPEIQAIVPFVLAALEDPGRNTAACLKTLLDTQFIHFIDAPSLALIMPVVERAFKERTRCDTRRMAAQIIGNMYVLVDQKDITPYLATVLPGLKDSLLDAAPEVRTVSARALGIIVRGMGETHFDDLLPWLMQTLTCEHSTVNRSGAAQGLAEVVRGLGLEKLRALMHEIVETSERTDIAAHVKDGYIMLFLYLPNVFGDDFIPFIGTIITPILKALADESEFVRETALKAGQQIVRKYADSCLPVFLPELEKGLLDDNWRIRYSSVQLLGDLLFRVSGIASGGNATGAKPASNEPVAKGGSNVLPAAAAAAAADDDENNSFGTEQSHNAIIRCLGLERRNKVLAGLYMGRSDVALMVRQTALHVWKTIVTNTPKTLREILATLIHFIIDCLASHSFDKRQIAARTLGDVVRKHGERVLPEIIPILEHGLDDVDNEEVVGQEAAANRREGVCVGLKEIMNATSKAMLLNYASSLVQTIEKALCDRSANVRQAAAKSFDSLHAILGARVLDDILPNMVDKLSLMEIDGEQENGDYALDGLKQIVLVKSRLVLPFLLPYLTKPSAVNAKALAVIATGASPDTINRHLNRILPALLDMLSPDDDAGSAVFGQQMAYCETLVLSVNDEIGINMLVETLLEYTRSEQTAQKRAAIHLLSVYCGGTKTDYKSHVPNLFRQLIRLQTVRDTFVLDKTNETLNAIVRSLEPKQQMYFVPDVRQSIRFALSDIAAVSPATARSDLLLPGLCVAKAVNSLLPVFREAILNGPSPADKEAAIHGLNELIRAADLTGLRATFMEIAGLLIRNLTDRFAASVRVAILDTLAVLIRKVGTLLKPFTPQLKSSIIRCLSDANKQVRLKAAYALSYLIVVHVRCEPVFAEVLAFSKSAQPLVGYDESSSGGSGGGGSAITSTSALRETSLLALRLILNRLPSDKICAILQDRQVLLYFVDLIESQDSAIRMVSCGCLAAFMNCFDSDTQFLAVFNDQLLSDSFMKVLTPGSGQQSAATKAQIHGRIVTVAVLLKEKASRFWLTDETATRKVTQLLGHGLGTASSDTATTQSAIRCFAYLLAHTCRHRLQPFPCDLAAQFARIMNTPTAVSDTKSLIANVCTMIARYFPAPDFPDRFVQVLVPVLVNGTKEKNPYVKRSSEIALVALLNLTPASVPVPTTTRTGNSRGLGESSSSELKRCLALLETGARDALNDVLGKILRKPSSIQHPFDSLMMTSGSIALSAATPCNDNLSSLADSTSSFSFDIFDETLIS